jgi:hypothetical protein
VKVREFMVPSAKCTNQFTVSFHERLGIEGISGALPPSPRPAMIKEPCATTPSSTMWSNSWRTLVGALPVALGGGPSGVVPKPATIASSTPSIMCWEQWHIHLDVCYARGGEREQAALLHATRQQLSACLMAIAHRAQATPCPPLTAQEPVPVSISFACE